MDKEIIQVMKHRIIECRFNRAEQVPYFKEINSKKMLHKQDIQSFLDMPVNYRNNIVGNHTSNNRVIVFTGYTKLSTTKRKMFLNIMNDYVNSKKPVNIVVMNPNSSLELGVVEPKLVLRYMILR